MIGSQVFPLTKIKFSNVFVEFRSAVWFSNIFRSKRFYWRLSKLFCLWLLNISRARPHNSTLLKPFMSSRALGAKQRHECTNNNIRIYRTFLWTKIEKLISVFLLNTETSREKKTCTSEKKLSLKRLLLLSMTKLICCRVARTFSFPRKIKIKISLCWYTNDSK